MSKQVESFSCESFEALSPKEQIELMAASGMHHAHQHCDSWFLPFLYRGDDVKKDEKVINLHYTRALLLKAIAMIKKGISGPVLFIGTKPAISDLVERAARDCKQYWCSSKWSGGFLTNSQATVAASLKRTDDLSLVAADQSYRKKEREGALREHERMLPRLLGLSGREFNGKSIAVTPPSLVVIIDPGTEATAVQEVLACRACNKDMNMIVVGDGFTPVGGRKKSPSFDIRSLREGDVFIPANDDGSASAGLILALLVDVIRQKQVEHDTPATTDLIEKMQQEHAVGHATI